MEGTSAVGCGKKERCVPAHSRVLHIGPTSAEAYLAGARGLQLASVLKQVPRFFCLGAGAVMPVYLDKIS